MATKDVASRIEEIVARLKMVQAVGEFDYRYRPSAAALGTAQQARFTEGRLSSSPVPVAGQDFVRSSVMPTGQ